MKRDYCTAQGAAALARRLTKYWADRGEVREFEAYYVLGDAKTRAVFGVRPKSKIIARAIEEAKTKPPIPIVPTPRPRDKVRGIILAVLRERHPSIPYSAVVAKVQKLRGKGTRALALARRDCMKAVRDAYGYSTPQIGRIFNCDHTTVVNALNDEFRARHNARVLKRYHEKKNHQHQVAA